MDMSATMPPWGKSVSINLSGCRHEFLTDPQHLRRYIADVIQHINMRSHGPVHLERFGDGSLEGYSAMQFIETSSITLHADEVHDRCFVDIFSCKDFNADAAALFTKKYFASDSMSTATLTR